MGLFSKLGERIADEKAAWNESSQALTENEKARQRKQEKQEKQARQQCTDRTGPVGDGGAGVVANIIVD